VYHPLAQLDAENDFVQPQHFDTAVTIGNTAPIPGTLPTGNLYVQSALVVGSSAPNVTGGTSGVLAGSEGTDWTNVAGGALIDFNSTTHEITVKTNGSNSAGMLVRSQPGAINQTAQVAAITTATLCAASAGACNQVGQYHVHFDVWGSGTACATPSPGGVTPSLTWIDENAVSHAAVVIPMSAQTSATAVAVNVTAPTVAFQSALGSEGGSGDFNISTNGTVIQYAVAYTACGTGTGTYNIRGTVTRLQ
jgi:hypothetical protein